MNTEFTLTQKRALAIFTIIALLFGAYFLRDFFVLIVVAAVGAYLFTPLFMWFNKRLGTGLSAGLTLLSALAMVIVPMHSWCSWQSPRLPGWSTTSPSGSSQPT